MASARKHTIGGRDFYFGKMTAVDALKVEMALAPVIVKALGQFSSEVVAADGSGKETAEQEAAKSLQTMKAFGSLMSAVSAEDFVTPEGQKKLGLMSIMGLVFGSITVATSPGAAAGADVDLATSFEGRPNKEKYEVFMEGLRENFADFFPAGLSVSPRAVAAK
jgi:hypothetical protein